MRRSVLNLSQILKWAEAFHKRAGRWPTLYSGPIRGTGDETWHGVDSALRMGLRGLAGGSSLAQMLAEERGARNLSNLPPLSAQQILAWADSHRRRTRTWPTSESGLILDAPAEKWKSVDYALRVGTRGLPGESSLARLLAKRRGVRNLQALPRLTVKQILIWADAHYRRTGRWPTRKSGPILGVWRGRSIPC